MNYNYTHEKPVNIQVLWEDLIENKLILDMGTLQIVSDLEWKAKVEVKHVDSNIWISANKTT